MIPEWFFVLAEKSGFCSSALYTRVSNSGGSSIFDDLKKLILKKKIGKVKSVLKEVPPVSRH